MRRRTLTLLCLLTGLGLIVVSYFFLTAPWGSDRVGNSNPRLEYAPLLTVLGVILTFASAVVYELLPDKDKSGEP
ncbi:MAG: hypothetical protein OEU32_07500 [Acidimicrobiia bacterium]|nr:hypothetical protein [Acidimicrobiia bacterium]